MMSAQKSQNSKGHHENSDSKNHIKYINLEDDNEINDTPGKKFF